MDSIVCARENYKSSAIAAASSRFGKFGNEPLHDARAAKVETNQAVEAMKTVWRESTTGTGLWESNQYQLYPWMLSFIKNLEYTATDVEAFSIAIAGFQYEKGFSGKAGIMLSALINNCREDSFIIHTAHLAEPIHSLGFRNTKNIAVEGNVGFSVGERMEGGSITVKGNAGTMVGDNMKGGVITLQGDAQNYVGDYMEGGRIVVEGNAPFVGLGMVGGEIHVNGDYESIPPNFTSGKIFHREKLIVDK